VLPLAIGHPLLHHDARTRVMLGGVVQNGAANLLKEPLYWDFESFCYLGEQRGIDAGLATLHAAVGAGRDVKKSSHLGLCEVI